MAATLATGLAGTLSSWREGRLVPMPAPGGIPVELRAGPGAAPDADDPRTAPVAPRWEDRVPAEA